jgi:hypothetical protein
MAHSSRKKVRDRSIAKNRERDLVLTANHRAHAGPFSQKPETGKLKLNPNPANNIETYESWNNLASIHFPDEQISTQNLMFLYHSQFNHTIYETLNLVKQFRLHTPC